MNKNTNATTASNPEPANDKRAQQARINGAKSHGPSTPEGKAISSRNALRHGFTSKAHILLDSEDPAEWQLHLNGYLATYAPINYVEQDLVHQLASISWRKSRLALLEVDLIDFQMSVQDPHIRRYFPCEANNSRLHLVFAWQGLARKAYPRFLPEDPNVAPDPTQPPDGLDIESIELVRRYQLALDRQFKSTLSCLRQSHKDFPNATPDFMFQFETPQTPAQEPEQEQEPEQVEPTAAPEPAPKAQNPKNHWMPNEPTILPISASIKPAPTTDPPSKSVPNAPEVAA